MAQKKLPRFYYNANDKVKIGSSTSRPIQTPTEGVIIRDRIASNSPGSLQEIVAVVPDLVMAERIIQALNEEHELEEITRVR